MAHSAFNPKNTQHDYFRELCSLAAIGELSADEFDELRNHLAGCAECRSLYTDFARITSSDLSLLFSDTDLQRDLEHDADGPNEKLLLARILDARDREPIAAEPPSEPLRVRRAPLGFVLRSRVRQFMPIAAGILVAVLGGVGAYRAAVHREARVIGKLEAEMAAAKDIHTRRETDGQRAAAQAAEAVEANRAQLDAALAKSQAEYAELAAREQKEQSDLTAAESRVTELGRELQSARAESEQQTNLRDQSQKSLQAALGELERLRFTQEQTHARLQEQERTISDLTSRLNKAADPAEAAADVDLAKLFGARDLHIVDVFDVDSNGKSRRTYGRVFYAEKKLLVFYAFDLEDKKRNRAAAGFQAWGYREPNASKPENLGLFYVDDPVFNRWVLKVNDAKVLQRIDAVFVTLEPSGGSPTPRGRKILYASLAGAANHP